MTSSRKNKTLFIDKEASSALELVKDNLLYPANSLMGKADSQEVLETGLIHGKTFPFPFILAPSGSRNKKVILSLEVGEELTILCEDEEFAILVVDETFEIDPSQRIKHIYGTNDLAHPGVQATMKRLGSWAVSGEYRLLKKSSNKNTQKIQNAKKAIDAKHTTALFMAVNPLHRAHERLIRKTLDNTD